MPKDIKMRFTEGNGKTPVASSRSGTKSSDLHNHFAIRFSLAQRRRMK
jgi:hypothetical protein